MSPAAASPAHRAEAGEGPRLCVYVRHDDAEREWAHDRNSGIGRLDRGLDEAKARGWTVVSMKDDWRRVFPFEGWRPLPSPAALLDFGLTMKGGRR